MKYPAIIMGLDDVEIEGASEFLDIIKPFRDSLVHPSPFSAPEKFGGYQKLKKLYELDHYVSIKAVSLTVLVINGISRFIGGSSESPTWLRGIEDWLAEHDETSS